MSNARLMTLAEDYTRLGIEPDVVEAREDGRREKAAPGISELWHFEAFHGRRHEDRHRVLPRRPRPVR